MVRKPSTLALMRARLEAGLPVLSGGAITNFIPTIWSTKILQTLDKALVYGQTGVINRDYEGEIKSMGDTVKIQGLVDPTVTTYTKNADITAAEVPADSTRSLVIDQGKVVNFAVDDVDAAQANANVLQHQLGRVGYAFGDVVDQFLAGKYADAGNTVGDTTTPIALSSSNIYDTLVDMATLLSEDNVPKAGRWVILPPWAVARLSKSDEFIAAAGSGESTIRNGFAGRAAGFDVMESNNVPVVSSTKYKILGGVSDAWTLAIQITKTEAYRPPLRFADAVKGLIVYGAKTVLPNGLVLLTATAA